jgi:hypothetical protein
VPYAPARHRGRSGVLNGVANQDRLWLGVTRAVTPDEPRSPGPAGRVFDLLFLVGTTPDYAAPVITGDLITRITDGVRLQTQR